MLNNVAITQSCLIFNEEWLILALKRADNVQERPGLWDIPGRLLDAQTLATLEWDIIHAHLHHMIKEQIGATVEDDSPLLVSSSNNDGTTTMHMMYLAMYHWDKIKLSEEHAAYERLSPLDFLERDSGWLGYEVEKAIRQLQDEDEDQEEEDDE